MYTPQTSPFTDAQRRLYREVDFYSGSFGGKYCATTCPNLHYTEKVRDSWRQTAFERLDEIVRLQYELDEIWKRLRGATK